MNLWRERVSFQGHSGLAPQRADERAHLPLGPWARALPAGLAHVLEKARLSKLVFLREL